MKVLSFLLTILLVFSNSFKVYADEDVYAVVDSSSGAVLEKFDNYKKALRYYNANKEKYINLSLLRNEKVIETEYATVYFNTDEGCTIEHEYQDNYTVNGCYGIDAAYLYTEYDEVYYMISGAVGHNDVSLLTVVPVNEHPENLSVYQNMEGVLYHNIKSEVESSYYSYSIELDESPEDLKEGTSYYSYDGHYFYDNYFAMIDDYVSEEHNRSVNKEAYYNYYQYLPFRSSSAYDSETIKRYFDDVLLIDGKLDSYDDFNRDGANDYLNRSQLYEELDAFFTAENIYGLNALSLLSISIYETSYGKNLASYLSNNLFRNAAFSSLTEKENQRYLTLENSIYSFARYYMAQKYTNPLRSSYKGGYLGNKDAGMNTEYSSDPYYGEKVASVYYRMDRALGFKDRNSEAIALTSGKTRVFMDEALENRLYSLSDDESFGYIILEEKDNCYKIQLDKCLNGDYLYNRKTNVAYIAKDNALVLNKENIHEDEVTEYTYDFNGGHILNISSLAFASDKKINEPIPAKEGYEFKEYVNGVAQYQKISSISLTREPEVWMDNNGVPIFKDGEIRVNYENGSHRYLELSSEMLLNYSNEEMTLSYCGVTLNVPIKVENTELLKEELKQTKSELIAYYKNNETVDKEKIELLKKNSEYIDYSMNEIRLLDLACKDLADNYPAVYIEENEYDLSFSGLYLAFDLNKNRNALQFYDDTYYVLNDRISITGERILSRYGEAYGFTIEGSINLGFRYNLETVEPDSPIIVEVKLPDKKDDRIYSVYHLDSEGNVVKCYTTQTSSYIQFEIREGGDYIFLSKKSANVYHFADVRENISDFNNGIDSFSIALQIMVFMAMTLYCMISFVIYYRLKGINRHIWQNYYRIMKYLIR